MNKQVDETTKPHTAVLSVQLEVHSLLDTGECSGKIVSQDVLQQHGIKDAFLAIVSGYNRDDCLRKLKAKLEALQNDDVESE